MRKRPLEGANGFWVVTPFVTSSGSTLVVNRGWIAAAGGAGAVQQVPAPPSGQVTIVGRVLPSEQAPEPAADRPPRGTGDGPRRQPWSAVRSDVYPGYVVLVSSDPAQAERPHPAAAARPVRGQPPVVRRAVDPLRDRRRRPASSLLVRRERDYVDGDGAARGSRRRRPPVRTWRNCPYAARSGTIARMDLGLTDRVFVVTGGSRGLGLASAEALVADGARVVVVAPRPAGPRRRRRPARRRRPRGRALGRPRPTARRRSGSSPPPSRASAGSTAP